MFIVGLFMVFMVCIVFMLYGIKTKHPLRIFAKVDLIQELCDVYKY